MKGLLRGFRSIDWRVALALVYTASLLTVLEYWFLPSRVEAQLRDFSMGSRLPPSLEAGLIWAGGSTIGYLVIPLLIVLFVHRERPASIGFRARGFIRHLWIYLVLYAAMIPVIFHVAERSDFQDVYPFVAAARKSRESFIRWEIGYLIQFIGLEAFFRGYLLFTLERKLGWTAIFVMAVPYCMIHYHKPPLEAFAAIGAGILLGGLALWLRSWWGGALLHGLVALTMDVLAVRKAGLF